MLRAAVSCSGALRVTHLLRLTAGEQAGTHAAALLQLHHWVYRDILYLVDLTCCVDLGLLNDAVIAGNGIVWEDWKSFFQSRSFYEPQTEVVVMQYP